MSDIATKIDELIALLERQNDRDRAAIVALDSPSVQHDYSKWRGVTAWLGVDGNAGFALVGPDLQEGESEFVCIDDAPSRCTQKQQKECWAATQALRRLESRLGFRLGYYVGPSHPLHFGEFA
jgi:hypothetical protein